MPNSDQHDGSTRRPSITSTQPGPLADTLQQTEPTSEETDGYRAGDLIAFKYQLTSLLGEGGMGAVWLAKNQTLHINVALKLIRRDIAVATARDRLLREARAAASLKHSSIVRVFDFGETALGDPFIVMELLEGEPLSAVLERKGNLSATRAVQTMLPIVSALAEVHALGIVHRDLKPENIILVAAANGSVTPKLVDFGIAKWRGRARVSTFDDLRTELSPQRSGSNRELTQMGAVMGSPNYMSPEQARADHDVDERADLWAIAVMLYEAVAGKRPFEGESLQRLLLEVLTKDPSPLQTSSDAELALWKIVERGLKRERAVRWQNARSLGRALARWLLQQEIEVDISGASIRQHWLGKAIVENSSVLPPDEGTPLLRIEPPTPTPGQIVFPLTLLSADTDADTDADDAEAKHDRAEEAEDEDEGESVAVDSEGESAAVDSEGEGESAAVDSEGESAAVDSDGAIDATSNDSDAIELASKDSAELAIASKDSVDSETAPDDSDDSETGPDDSKLAADDSVDSAIAADDSDDDNTIVAADEDAGTPSDLEAAAAARRPSRKPLQRVALAALGMTLAVAAVVMTASKRPQPQPPPAASAPRAQLPSAAQPTPASPNPQADSEGPEPTGSTAQTEATPSALTPGPAPSDASPTTRPQPASTASAAKTAPPSGSTTSQPPPSPHGNPDLSIPEKPDF